MEGLNRVDLVSIWWDMNGVETCIRHGTFLGMERGGELGECKIDVF